MCIPGERLEGDGGKVIMVIERYKYASGGYIGLLVLYLDKGKCDTLHDPGGGVRFSIVVSRGRLTRLNPSTALHSSRVEVS